MGIEADEVGAKRGHRMSIIIIKIYQAIVTFAFIWQQSSHHVLTRDTLSSAAESRSRRLDLALRVRSARVAVQSVIAARVRPRDFRFDPSSEPLNGK